MAKLKTPTLDEVNCILSKRRLTDFMVYESGGKWIRAKHLDLLCGKLESVERGDIKRLMVFMPPRHGKSEVISKKFPAWYLGRNPDNEIIMVSYAADLVLDHSKIARDTLKEWGQKIFGVTVAKDSGAADRWTLTKHRGGLTASGVGGPITGRGAHVAIIDDPVKNQEDADSETIRHKTWEWYKTTLRTRLAPGGAIVLVMTRWHEDDLAGRLLKHASEDEEGSKWEIISIPAEAEEDDALGRSIGEWLWPERYPEKEYRQLRVDAGSRGWTALYQQRPSPDEGGLIKRNWWRYWHYQDREQSPVQIKLPNGEIIHIKSEPLPGRFDEMIQSWDTTFKDDKASKTGNPDYVVGQAWGRLLANKYLLDQDRGRKDFPATITAVERMTKKWPQTRAKLIEDKANGPAVIAILKRKISGLIEVNPEGGKVARANAVSPDIESGNVFLPHPNIAPWVYEFLDECSAFPNGKYDDQVDAMTQALNRLMYHGFSRAPKEELTGTYHYGELKLMGYSDAQIRRLKGVKILGKRR